MSSFSSRAAWYSPSSNSAAAAGQGVFAQFPGRLPADPLQADGQAVGGGQGVGVVLAQVAAAAGQGVFV
jgi:hypothetical protein